MFKAWQNGRTLNSVIRGTEQGSANAVVAAQGLLARVARGETVTPEEIAKVLDKKFKTGIQSVAILDGTEEHLAPRVEKITEHLDPAELRKRLGVLMFFVLFLGLGCSSIKHDHVLALERALQNERKAVAPLPGFEVSVAASRAAEDELLDKMKKATK